MNHCPFSFFFFSLSFFFFLEQNQVHFTNCNCVPGLKNYFLSAVARLNTPNISGDSALKKKKDLIKTCMFRLALPALLSLAGSVRPTLCVVRDFHDFPCYTHTLLTLHSFPFFLKLPSNVSVKLTG